MSSPIQRVVMVCLPTLRSSRDPDVRPMLRGRPPVGTSRRDRSETGGDELPDDIGADLDAILFVNQADVGLGLRNREQQVGADSEFFARSNKGLAVNAGRRRCQLEAFSHASDGGATPTEWQPAR